MEDLQAGLHGLAHPARLKDVEPAAIPGLLVQLAAVRSAIAARALAVGLLAGNRHDSEAAADHLVDI